MEIVGEKSKKSAAGTKKARPQGRAALGAGVRDAPSGSHPDTCDLAAAREAVVEMHVVEGRRGHHGKNAIRSRTHSQQNPGIDDGNQTIWQAGRLRFRAVVNNFTYCDLSLRSAAHPFIVFGSGGLK
jgi:hypothetical protein